MPGRIRLPEIPEKLRVFSIASFLNDFGAEMVYSVWPLFVTTFLGADLIVLGLIDGIGNMVVSFSQAGSGYLSDRFGRRKPFIVAGYTLAGISKVGYALATAWPILVPLRAMDRLGKIRDAPRDAEVADLSPVKTRGTNFGILDMFDNAGAVAGIIAAFLLFGILGFQRLFLFAAVPSIAAAVLIATRIRDGPRKRGGERFRLASLGGNYRVFLLSSCLLALGTFSYSFVIIAGQEAGFAASVMPMLYLALSVAAMMASAVFGNAADRFGRRGMIAVSVAMLAIAAASMSLGGAILSVLAFIAYGVYLGSIKPLQKTLASDLAPEQFRASALGVLQLLSGIAALPASLFVGFLWESHGSAAAMAFSIVMAMLSLLALLAVKEQPKDNKP